MRALNRKLWRDLWHLRGMVAAVALVLVGGVATYIMSLSTYDSLLFTRQSYYREQRFAEVFASLKRAPQTLRARIADIPGVNRIQTRVVASARLDIPGYHEPVSARLISLPGSGQALLNVPYLRRGRLLRAGRDDEVLVNEAFAEAHGLAPGDRIAAVVNGRRRQLRIVGVVLSPEYIYQIAPGAVFPDFEHYGILWTGRKALAAAYDMEDAFNDVALSLYADASPQDVVERLDRLLARYGGRGAYLRKDQLSHRFLSQELRGLRTMAVVFPTIFLGVAVFLLNVILNRLINTQRRQIGILKAFGYRDLEVGRHYAALVLCIVLLGTALGILAGIWLGKLLSAVYTDFYRFPFLHYRLEPRVVAGAVLFTLATGIVGTLYAVRRVVRLPPAEAMRPEAPPVYRPSLIERLGLQRLLSQPTRMIARHLERHPLKTLLSLAGLAAAYGIVMVANFQEDAIHYMIDVQYSMAQRQDMTVMLTEPVSHRALYSLASLRGVRQVEGMRSVPARLRHGHYSHRGSIQGLQPGGDLRRVLDGDLQRVPLPTEGVVLTDYLADMLHLRPGDSLTVEVLEGERPVLEVPVAGLTSEYLGVSAYMRRQALNRLMKEGDRVNGVLLAVDRERHPQVYRQLEEMPAVAATVVRASAVKSFYRTMQETILFFSSVASALGAIIAFGVVYNSARIALSERSRELASLRVLGFTHGEIAYILLGELALLVLMAAPPGFLFGRFLCAYLADAFRSDLYRVPLVLEAHTYAFAASVVLVSVLLSGFMMWQRLRRLDLVAVLKTRE